MTNKDFAIGMNKIFYYSMNYRCIEVTYKDFSRTCTECLPEFFRDNIFTCNTAHMVKKWHGATIKKYDDEGNPEIFHDSYGVMWRFYAELDGDNRARLAAWINENFKQDENFGINLSQIA